MDDIEIEIKIITFDNIRMEPHKFFKAKNLTKKTKSFLLERQIKNIYRRFSPSSAGLIIDEWDQTID
jgi:hypothetical protein